MSLHERQLELAYRRGILQARSAQQRQALSRHAQPVIGVCAAGDQALAGVDWLKRHPLAVFLTTFALVVAKPIRAYRWGRRGFKFWQAFHLLRKKLSGLS